MLTLNTCPIRATFDVFMSQALADEYDRMNGQVLLRTRMRSDEPALGLCGSRDSGDGELVGG